MDTDKRFAGSIPDIYDTLLVPLIFEPYALDLARRLASAPPRRILEIAAGTGVVTRAMDALLPPDVVIVATDLNETMIARARAIGTTRDVKWQSADAMALPFEDGAFDAVVCQFGAMFFPDKPKAFSETRRVLAPGGRFLFNVWDRIEENELPAVVTSALAETFPDDPPRFMERTPHGYWDVERVRQDLALGGFTTPASITTLAHGARAPSARDAAIAFCQGTPWRNEIEARDPARLEEATTTAAKRIAGRFGDGPAFGKIQAHIVDVTR
jgi:SAM-dependent methyltransferase